MVRENRSVGPDDDHLKDWNEALQIEGQTDWNGMHNDKMECV